MISRERLRKVVDSKHFQRFIVAVIVINAVTLGLETSSRAIAEFGWLLYAVDQTVLVIFVVELLLRVAAHGWRFFRDPWNVFDFVIVGIALIPASGAFSVLRTLRVLRVLRLVSQMPSMRGVVAALLISLPGIASVVVLLALLLYVAAVMATQMFGAEAPDRFGDMGVTLFTLFQVATGDDWADIARTAMAVHPWAWIFFVIYLLASTFILLNLFGAVMGHSLTAAGGMEINVAAVKADIAAVKADVAEVKADVIKYRRENAETAEAILAQAREQHARIIAELRQLQSATARSSSSPESPEVYTRDGSPGP